MITVIAVTIPRFWRKTVDDIWSWTSRAKPISPKNSHEAATTMQVMGIHLWTRRDWGLPSLAVRLARAAQARNTQAMKAKNPSPITPDQKPESPGLEKMPMAP